jgi:hypothetical protein
MCTNELRVDRPVDSGSRPMLGGTSVLDTMTDLPPLADMYRLGALPDKADPAFHQRVPPVERVGLRGQ